MESRPLLKKSVESLLETLPPVWDRIRANLRAAGTSRFGISLEQFHVLRHIRRGCDSVAALADKKQTSRSAVSQAVEVLVAKGLVERREDGEDRRRVRLGLTPHASRVMDLNYAETFAWTEARMASLSDEELACLAAAMGILERTFVPDES